MKREFMLKEENNELKTRESKSCEEIQELNKVESSNEKEIQRLGNKLQQQVVLLEQEKQKSVEKGSLTQLINTLKKQLADKMETMNVYQILVQSKNNEITLLKKDNQRYENIEKENMELKRKLEEYERRSQPLADNSSGNNSATPTNSSIQLDSQVPLNTPNGAVDNIRVKIETESKNDSLSVCQIGTKKRKLSSNDS